jgi:RNA polymerase sigma-70 factor (ECF subfamily)
MVKALPPQWVALRGAPKAEKEEAWRSLYHEHFDRLYRLASFYGMPAAEIEDIVQTAFVRVQQRIEAGEPVLDVRAFLAGVTIRVVAEHRRWRRVRFLKRWLVESTTQAEAVPHPTPEHDAELTELRGRIGNILGQMSAKLRDTLVLVDMEQCSNDEAAAILGIPVNTVRSRTRLAREEFRRLWSSDSAEGEA